MLVCVDVTEMLNVNFISGIQRVVKEILTRWIETGATDLRLLNYNFSKQVFEVVDKERFYEIYTTENQDKRNLLTSELMKIEDFSSDMCFFDMDSVWMNFCKRSWLLPKLKKQGAKVVALIYDIIPITDAQYCHEFTTFNFMEYFGAHLQYGDMIICNANATIDAIRNLVDGLGMEKLSTKVVPLGSDFKNTSIGTASKEVVEIAGKGKYILMVGTLEPRKNHAYVYKAFCQKLFSDGWNLIFAGRVGWNIEGFMQEIQQHTLYNQQLFHIKNASDEDIDFLYKNSYAVAFPSYNEGYGLPIIEAFDRQTVVLAADIPILKEIGEDYCVYFDLKNPSDFVNKLQRLSDDPAEYERNKSRLSKFRKHTWNEAAELMKEAVYSVQEQS